MRFRLSSALVLIGATVLASAADDPGRLKDAAVRLYDQGKYDEARTALLELDVAKSLDGPLLYRLFFCEKATGHDAESRAALERASAALQKELAASQSLEVAFYLANAYANLGRQADARQVAADMTAKIESGAVPPPKSGIALFQTGKLYQDQSRQDKATDYYEKAVGAFDLVDGRYVGNARWALRYLGNNAFAGADFAASEKYLARLTALAGAEAADWDALAAARARQGKYALAAEAWKSSVKVNAADADDARYSARLAETAAAIAPLPAKAPDSPEFRTMSQADLEGFLKTKSAEAIAAQARTVEKAERAAAVAALLETRRQFVAAGLEYAVRRYGIRETAFREGYAVLIFQDRAWELPEAAPPAKSADKSGS